MAGSGGWNTRQTSAVSLSANRGASLRLTSLPEEVLGRLVVKSRRGGSGKPGPFPQSLPCQGGGQGNWGGPEAIGPKQPDLPTGAQPVPGDVADVGLPRCFLPRVICGARQSTVSSADRGHARSRRTRTRPWSRSLS